MSLTFRAAIADPEMLGALPAFADQRSWETWLVFDDALHGVPLTPEGLEVFRRYTGRTAPRPGGYRIGLLLTGRQAGKTTYLATRAAFDAAVATKASAPGSYVTFVGQDLRATMRAAFRAARDVFAAPAFAVEVERETQDLVELRSGVSLAVLPCRPSSTRGVRNLAAYMDEAAHFTSGEGRRVDREMFRALLPSLLTTGGRLLIASSPYAASGLCWELHKRHHGIDSSDVLTWQAPSAAMHPGLDAAWLDAMRLEDPEAAESEIDGRFRRALSMVLDDAALDACTVDGRTEIPPENCTGAVECFADPSAGGGVGDDHFAAAWGYWSGDRGIVVALRAWAPPFDPRAVVEEVAETCRRYGVSLVTTDHYGGNLVASLFAEAGLQHRVSELPASDLYLRFVTTVQTRRIELPDPALSGTAQRLLRELRSVERRPGPGKDQATAPRGEGHADLGNAVAGLAFLLSQRASAPAVLIDSEALLIPRATPSPSFGYDPNALELPESDMTAEESWDASVALGRRARRFGW